MQNASGDGAPMAWEELDRRDIFPETPINHPPALLIAVCAAQPGPRKKSRHGKFIPMGALCSVSKYRDRSG